MLTVEGLQSGYGPMQVLWSPSLQVQRGSITALLGPNGAGKTTLLRTILGTLPPWGGRIVYEDREITGLPPHRQVGMGITLVPEGRHLFPNMTVRENLIMGAYPREASPYVDESLELVYALFPILRERARQPAGTLSGGQQQMLAIARGLMTRPRLLMLDEPSLGLAPKLVEEVFRTVQTMREEGLTIFLVEQNVDLSLAISDFAYILHEGQIKAEGPAEEIRASHEVREAYLGI